MRKIVAILLTAVCSIALCSSEVNAATYQTWCTRGIKFLCWSKCTIDWTTNSTKIKSYDAEQQRSGILVVLEGCKKLKKSTKTTYYINSKTELLVGAEISGVTIGWATTVTDQATIRRDGSCDWDFGI